MNKKNKFRIADRNKPGIDGVALRLLAIFECDRDALQKEIDGLQEEKNSVIRDPRYQDATELRDREKVMLATINAIDSIDTLKEATDLLEDCIFFEYAPNDIRKICELFIKKREAFKSTKPKDMTSYERRLIKVCGMAKSIMEYTPYKFFFLGGAMAEHRTLFAKDHKEAWNKANEYCVESFDGNIRGILCLTKDGEDIGTLKNIGAMFTPMPEDPKEARGVRAVDLVPEYENYK